MAPFVPAAGPLAGEPSPVYGGDPGPDGCSGCIDCCHLPEISVTDEEAERIRVLFRRLDGAGEKLVLAPDESNPGWQIMQGPCVFRRPQRALQGGGCAIYDERPASCRIFTCRLLLDMRRNVERYRYVGEVADKSS